MSTPPGFPPDYHSVLSRIEEIDPLLYDKTRNYISGAVSYLSPYLSRGVITPVTVRSVLLRKYNEAALYKFTFELAWREYFQHVWWQKGDNIFSDLNTTDPSVVSKGIPAAVLESKTSILEINKGVEQLYDTGYLHNHLRLYIASVCTNIARVHWYEPARWMYYHLLDADPASNLLSWQWVAGTFSSKKYYFNQENMNKYTGSTQRGTPLDVSYDDFPLKEIPPEFRTTAVFHHPVIHLQSETVEIPDDPLPVFVYTPFHLDPEWRATEKGHRLFWWPEPLMTQLPMSERTIRFIEAFACNIPGMQFFKGTYAELLQLTEEKRMVTRRHPLFKSAKESQLDTDHLLFPEITNVSGSFMRYWKKCEEQLRKSDKR